MKKLKLVEIVGKEFTDREGREVTVLSFEPVGRAFRYRVVWKNPPDVTEGTRYSADLSFIGVVVDFTEEELHMIERARLTHAVEAKARELKYVVTVWLNHLEAR